MGVLLAVAAATWALPAVVHAAGPAAGPAATLQCASGALVAGQSRATSCGSAAAGAGRRRGLSLIPGALCVQMQELTHDAASGLLPVVTGLMDARVVPTVPLRCAPLPRRDSSTAAHHTRHAPHSSIAGKPAHAVHTTSTAKPAHAATRAARARTRSVGRHGQRRTAAATGTLQLPVYAPLSASSVGALDAAGMGGLALKFAIVMALLFVCLRVLKAVMPRMSVRRHGAAGAVILHTESIGPKRSMQVLDLGVRILFVGVSGATMTPLTTVDDPAELAALRVRYGAAAPGEEPAAEGPAAHHPSFARALALSMGLKTVQGGQSEASDSTSAPVPAQGPLLEAGDPALGGALDAIRGLRRRVARA